MYIGMSGGWKPFEVVNLSAEDSYPIENLGLVFFFSTHTRSITQEQKWALSCTVKENRLWLRLTCFKVVSLSPATRNPKLLIIRNSG